MLCPHCLKEINDNFKICPYCGKEAAYQNPANALPVGTMLAERYYVGAVLGQGGFGITYIGNDTRLNKKIAIKEYYPSGMVNRLSEHSTSITITAGDSANMFEHEKEKFVQEAYLLAQFAGDRNVVNVSDVFQAHNTAYFVMDYVEGDTLTSYLKANGKMSFTAAYHMLRPMMMSLSAIHAKGLIHRDISPANIMVQKDGQVTLLDFGAAREFTNDGNKSLSVILKHGYAPTEQYMTKGEQGPWTDVYAVCATIYKMITTQAPPSAVDRSVADSIVRPSAAGALISPIEEDALMRGLAVYAKDRIASMQELIDAFSGKTAPKAGSVAYEATEMLTPGAAAKNTAPGNAEPTPVFPDQAANQTQVLTPEAVTSAANPAPAPAPEPVAAPVQTTQIPSGEKKKKNLVPIIAAVVAVWLVVVGVVGFLATRGGGSSTKKETAASTEDNSSVFSDNYFEGLEKNESSDTTQVQENSTVTASDPVGTYVPDSFYFVTENSKLTDYLKENAFGIKGEGKDLPKQYQNVDLNGDGADDVIGESLVGTSSGDAISYTIDFSDGSSLQTPMFGNNLENEGVVIQFRDINGDKIDEILFTHIMSYDNVPVATQSYFYVFDKSSKQWQGVQLIKMENNSYSLEQSVENVLFDEYQIDRSRIIVLDLELTDMGFALLFQDPDYGLNAVLFDFDGVKPYSRENPEWVKKFWPQGV